MTGRVDNDVSGNTHFFSLTGLDENGSEITYRLIPVNPRTGSPDFHSVRYSGFPTANLRGETGDGEFSIKRKPYGEFSKRDWSGGLGALNGLTDARKYWMGKRIWSVVPQRLMLQPQLFRSKINFPIRTGNEANINKPLIYQSVPAGTRVAWKVVLDYAATGLDVLLRTLVGNTFTLNIKTDVAGSPGVLVDTVEFANTVLGGNRYQFEKAIVAGTYWFEISGTAAFEIGTSAQTAYTVKTSLNGTDWSASAWAAPIFFVMSATGASDWHFFTYKWGTYVASGAQLWINGDRGACDSNTGNLNKVIDATKNWTVNQFAGATVKLTNELLGWRKIISNDATSLTLDRALPIATTTGDFYVIVGADAWTEITGHGLTGVYDAKSFRDDTVYFAQGPAVQMRRMREYNNSGTWTREFAEDTQSVVGGALPGANFLCPTFDQLAGPVLYKVVNSDLGFVAKAPAVDWGNNLVFGTEIKVGGDNWEDLTGVSEYDGKMAVMAMDGAWMVKNGVAEKVSIDMQSQWTHNTGRRPCVMPPYLVFPFGNRIQRLYSSIVESFGPERDSALPARYDGQIMDNLSLVGGLAIAKSGGLLGQYNQDAEGGAFLYRDGGWHPLAFTGLGSNMTALWYQMRYDEMDIIWFGDHNGLWYMYVPREWDYTKDARYDQTNRIEQDGWFISGWYDTGQLLPAKWWDFVTVFADNLSAAAGRKIRVYYQVSDGTESEIENLAADWTFAEEITAGYNNTITLNKQGRRIRFLFLLMGDGDSTPILHGFTCNYISKSDDAESWQMGIRLKDLGYDLTGSSEEITVIKDQSDILNYWARTVRPLTMNCTWPLWDNREVQIMRPGLTPLFIDKDQGMETMYANLTLLGMEEPVEEPPEDVLACPIDAPANGPFEVVMSGTIQPDLTTGLSGSIVKTVRTAQHTNITTYTVYGTFYDKDGNGAWQTTLNDDFYDVWAKDIHGNIVAVGVHDAVNPATPNVRTGTFTTPEATKIASIEIHIHGTAIRPTTVYHDAYPYHFWMIPSMNKGALTWGYTEYGVWARVTGMTIDYQTTAAGWDFISWVARSMIWFGEPLSFAGTTLAIRQMLGLASRGDEVFLDAYGTFDPYTDTYNDTEKIQKWYDNFADFNNGSYLTQVQEFTILPDTGSHKDAGVTARAYINIGNDKHIDVEYTHFVWMHLPPQNKIIITGAGLGNVCP